MREKFLTYAEAVKRFLFTDSGVFIILGLTFIAKSAGYLQNSEWPPGPLSHFERLLGAEGWEYIWLSMGLLLLAAAFINKTIFSAITFALSLGILFIWSGFVFVSGDSTFYHHGSLGLGLIAMSLLTIWRGHTTQISVTRHTKRISITHSN